jgi:hypothetical protein
MGKYGTTAQFARFGVALNKQPEATPTQRQGRTIMDLVTAAHVAGVALSIAQTAWNAGDALYNFVQGAIVVDSAAAAFAGEVKVLGATCLIMSSRLQNIVQSHDGHDSPDDSVDTSSGQA